MKKRNGPPARPSKRDVERALRDLEALHGEKRKPKRAPTVPTQDALTPPHNGDTST